MISYKKYRRSSMKSIFAWMQRFIINSQVTREERNSSCLLSNEIRAALRCIIRIILEVNFNKEIQRLAAGYASPNNSSIIFCFQFYMIIKY